MSSSQLTNSIIFQDGVALAHQYGFHLLRFWLGQVLDLLAEIGTKEVVKNGKFTLPGASPSQRNGEDSLGVAPETYGNSGFILF